MKKVFYLILISLIISCSKTQINYVSIKGELKSGGIEKLKVLGGNGFSKEINVDADGTFSDTLKVVKGLYTLTSGNQRMTIFLDNGYDLTLIFNGEKFADGVGFNGEGKTTNNYFSKLLTFFTSEKNNPKEYFKLDEVAYKSKLEKSRTTIKEFNKVGVDSMVIELIEKNNNQFFDFVEGSYEREHSNFVKFAAGKKSPEFNNYENFKGGKTSLSDLKGKYTYLDIWATWCGPCKREIPSLKNLEKEFHGKNIEFVSISVDNVDGKRGSHESWRKMVTEEQLGGIQLFADKDFRSDFIKAYGINSIPRFILLDPDGNIVDANADRPSNPKLKELFKELGI